MTSKRLIARVLKAGTPYEVLAVPPGAALPVIKSAHRALANLLHPDRNSEAGAADAMAAVNVAWDTLSNSAERKRLDTLLHTKDNVCTRCGGQGTVNKQHGFARKVKAPCPACAGSGEKDPTV